MESRTRRKRRTRSNSEVTPPFLQNSPWSDREILCLTLGLQRFGFSELEKIAELIQTKDVNDVKNYLSTEISKIRHTIARQDAKPIRINGSWYHLSPEEVERWPVIRKWRRLMYNQQLPCVKAHDYSKFIMEDLFERFYEEEEEPTDPQVANFKAIYKYFLECFHGHMPAELPPIESCVVLVLFEILSEIKNNLDISEEMQFIRNFKKAKRFAPMKIKSEFKERTKQRTKVLGNNSKMKTLLKRKKGSSSVPNTSDSLMNNSETAELSNMKSQIIDMISVLTNTPSESLQSIPKSSKLNSENVKNSSVVPELASEVTVSTTIEPELAVSEMEEEVSENETEAIEDENNTIRIPEEIYVKLAKHRKLVQSFNPLNVPMWCLVTEQAYVQNSCEEYRTDAQNRCDIESKSQPNKLDFQFL